MRRREDRLASDLDIYPSAQVLKGHYVETASILSTIPERRMHLMSGLLRECKAGRQSRVDEHGKARSRDEIVVY